MSDGWAVKVTKSVAGGWESTVEYVAHIPDPYAAEEAVRKVVQATPDTHVRFDRRVDPRVFRLRGIAPGAVEKWALTPDDLAEKW